MKRFGWLSPVTGPRRGPARAAEPGQAETLLRSLEGRLIHLQRDVDQLKARSATTLAPDRALTHLRTGAAVLVDPRDRGCGLNLLASDRYEEDEAAVIRRFLAPGGVFLDVGANYGYHSLRAAPYLRPGGRVVAFEPNPHIHDLLRLSVALNGMADMVDAHRLAASDRPGSVAFTFDPEGPGGGHIAADGEADRAGACRITVPAVRLDDHLAPDVVANAVKIDVEGREEQVLRGMARLVARSPAIGIVMEFIHGFYADQAQVVRLVDFVTRELGLALFRIGPGGTLAPVDAAGLRGVAGSLLLCRADQAVRPALTIPARQLGRGPGTRLVDGRLRWERRGPPAAGVETIAYGPYVFLPHGGYRLRLAGRFDGSFICAINENSGDRRWEARLTDCADPELMVHLDRDVQHAELSFWPATRRDARFALERAELWSMLLDATGAGNGSAADGPAG